MATIQEIRWAQNFFTNDVLPAYRRQYPNMNDPGQLVVDNTINEIDGGGGPGVVYVSGGVCAGPIYLKIFAITHETGHGVANIECTMQGINCPQPINNDAKKHEAWADLIATRILLNFMHRHRNSVFSYMNNIVHALGAGGTMHPSGRRRVEIMNEYRKTRAGFFKRLIPFIPFSAKKRARKFDQLFRGIGNGTVRMV